MGPSRSAIKKAGTTVRRHARGEASEAEYEEALAVIGAYRASFTSPLVKVNNGLRNFLSTLGIDAEVSQRLKRMETIVDKLATRETALSLDRMGDIGGCRVVLADDSIDDLRRVDGWIDHRWGSDIIRRKDYIEQPRESGYRAIHLVVKRDDRPIEIQLRTARMHEWAQLIESLSQHAGVNFKQDGGSDPVSNFGRELSLAHQQLDDLRNMSQAERIRLRHAEEDLLRFIAGGTHTGGEV